jgi:hypothetical protein
MGQLLRFATGRIRVPGDLADGARWALHHHLDDPLEGFYDRYEQDLAALRRLRPLRRYQSGFVAVDGDELSRVRNLADTDTLGFSPACDELTEAGDAELGAHAMCGQCEWCRALLLRDRIDFWFDRAGVAKNAYIGDVDPDIEALWDDAYHGRRLAA